MYKQQVDHFDRRRGSRLREEKNTTFDFWAILCLRRHLMHNILYVACWLIVINWDDRTHDKNECEVQSWLEGRKNKVRDAMTVRHWLGTGRSVWQSSNAGISWSFLLWYSFNHFVHALLSTDFQRFSRLCCILFDRVISLTGREVWSRWNNGANLFLQGSSRS